MLALDVSLAIVFFFLLSNYIFNLHVYFGLITLAFVFVMVSVYTYVCCLFAFVFSVFRFALFDCVVFWFLFLRRMVATFYLRSTGYKVGQ